MHHHHEVEYRQLSATANYGLVPPGIGGGIPGIFIAILKPDNKINLLESSTKKCFFLKTTIKKLSLTNTKVINKTLKENNKIGEFDVITARAFASIKKIITLTKNNTHKNSRYL